ncbi:MAG: hypothetical protein KF795_18970 [Labilithrix sp.]|nr:hypothetical protein [Labilithrix sp.]
MLRPLRSTRSRARLVTASVVALVLTTLAPVGAEAAPRRPSSKAQVDSAVEEAAKARYAEGFRLYTKRRYEEARVAFFQATALKRRPSATLMLALSSLKVGRWLDAARELDAYVSEVGEVPPKLREIVEAGRREAERHIGRLRFDVPEGAEVTVDGERVARLDEPLDVTAGRHVVVVTHRDEKKTETVEAVAGGTVDVKPSFVPKALVPTADTRTRPLPPKSEDAAAATEGPSLLSPPATTWPVYVAGAIGLGGLATAAIFGGLAANSSHAVDVASETLTRNGQSRATCDQQTIAAPFDGICRTLRKNDQLARDHQGTFGAAAIVGVSATAIAVGWFLLAPKERAGKEPESGARVVPWVGRDGGGGATLQGRF